MKGKGELQLQNKKRLMLMEQKFLLLEINQRLVIFHKPLKAKFSENFSFSGGYLAGARGCANVDKNKHLLLETNRNKHLKLKEKLCPPIFCKVSATVLFCIMWKFTHAVGN